MAKAQVVIGANFGDEGKGLMTDYLANGKSLNVLFNGGAQRGHTVERPGGFRHVFHHLGSGTLMGASTLLTHHFISNPMALRKESSLAVSATSIYADQLGRITTPYDIAINQIVEEARGNGRHGSCGMGINETIVRHKIFPLYIGSLHAFRLKLILTDIKESWVPERLKELGIEKVSDKWSAILESHHLIDNFILDCKAFVERVGVVDERELIHRSEDIIFEAGQGLLLDEDGEYFPYVTHSKTGLDNIRELTDKDLEVFYMTRWYATRHGAGPFETELTEKPSPYIEDVTNIPNDYQGSLRFGTLDLALLKKSINKDIKDKKRVQASVVITCIDQAKEEVSFKQGTVNINDIVPYVSYETGMNVSHISNGPTRETMLEV